jgi:uncharacterized protein YjiS (DUF1127 family)
MFLLSIVAGIDRWFRYRTTLRELSGLSDHELKDLGIHRSDISAVAQHGR